MSIPDEEFFLLLFLNLNPCLFLPPKFFFLLLSSMMCSWNTMVYCYCRTTRTTWTRRQQSEKQQHHVHCFDNLKSPCITCVDSVVVSRISLSKFCDSNNFDQLFTRTSSQACYKRGLKTILLRSS